MLQTSMLDTPCGVLRIATYDGRLVLCDWANEACSRKMARITKSLGCEAQVGASPLAAEVARQLGEYFAAKRREFELPLFFVGTDFQVSVWQSLLDIPYGRTITYAEQSRRIGRPDAVRAVAAADGANPISVIAPCHRVIGSNGRLTGYAGGLDIKLKLLSLEQNLLFGNLS